VEYAFYVADVPEAWQLLAENVGGRILSIPVAGGFASAYIGMYASSNGQPSGNVADLVWFEYTEIQPYGWRSLSAPADRRLFEIGV
jgi:alpha-N-arabinofuranosidase